MSKARAKFSVYVNLDPTPGTFHSAESAQNVLRGMLLSTIPHYNPMVSLESSNVRAPRPSEPSDLDKIMHDYAERLQKMYDNRTAGDYSFLGILAEFMETVVDNPDVMKKLVDRHNRYATISI